MVQGKYVVPASKRMCSATAMKHSTCVQCERAIEAGAQCFWVHGVGIFHVSCVQDPNEGGR